MRCLGTTLSIVHASGMPNRAIVSVRLKRLGSIRRKLLRRDTNFTLGRLDDVVGVRIICENLSIVEQLGKRIVFSPHFYRQKDYITDPAVTGYRGVHQIMKFQQSVTPTIDIAVRFEIQARTYLQHRWAVWSESHGEAIKLGTGSTEQHDCLRALSERIARWEQRNSAARQIELSDYTGSNSVAVCWRPRHGPVAIYFFADDVETAVHWLNRLESGYPGERQGALLLAGITDTHQRQKLTRLLRMTHPLYVGAPVPTPESWLP